MAAFDDESLLDALNRSIRGAKHLRVRDSALVAGARGIARKIDEGDGRTDHVLYGSYLNFLKSLQLMPPEEDAPAKKPAVKAPVDELAKFRAVKSG